jgi:hypothetical protein
VTPVRSATPTRAALSRAHAPRKGRPSSPVSSAAAPAPSASQPADPQRREVASTLDANANTTPPVAAIAVTVAALGALAGCGFVFARRSGFALARRRPRPMPTHSHRAPRRRSRRSIWR